MCWPEEVAARHRIAYPPGIHPRTGVSLWVVSTSGAGKVNPTFQSRDCLPSSALHA